MMAFPALLFFFVDGVVETGGWQDCLAHAAAETEPLHAALKQSGAFGVGEVSFHFNTMTFLNNKE